MDCPVKRDLLLLLLGKEIHNIISGSPNEYDLVYDPGFNDSFEMNTCRLTKKNTETFPDKKLYASGEDHVDTLASKPPTKNFNTCSGNSIYLSQGQ
jgi:hypothetical protein